MKSAACAALLSFSGLVGGAAFAAPMISTVSTSSATPPLHAQVVCERAGVVGRVRCDVEAQVDGARIAWGDAQIVDCPKFAFPLKGRIGPDDAAIRTPERWRWAFGLVAKDLGAGSISVRVRAVVCTDRKQANEPSAELCVPTSLVIAAQLVVGS